jgi:hypothetical protein
LLSFANQRWQRRSGLQYALTDIVTRATFRSKVACRPISSSGDRPLFGGIFTWLTVSFWPIPAAGLELDRTLAC